MKSYQPQWLRLSEVILFLESKGFTEQDAKDWLLRAMQDRLRADIEEYGSQSLFRVEGFPSQWKRRGNPDWPARVTHDQIDWENSKIEGQHPLRVVWWWLLIEVSAGVLSDTVTIEDVAAAETKGKRLTPKTVGAFVQDYVASDPNPTLDGIRVHAKERGIIGGRDLYEPEYRRQMKSRLGQIRPGRRYKKSAK